MKTPVYFISHGGPNIIEDTTHPAYKKLGEIGKEIATQVKPQGIVIFSAHWESDPASIQVNTAETTDLIYDFYNFPPHYYEWKFANVGSKEISSKVLASLQAAGIQAEGVKRGLDHGAWAPLSCAFNPEHNPLTVPVVQASIFSSDDPDQHYRLGEAITALREQGIVIIVSGMAVHNLRDLRSYFLDKSPKPYATTFDSALREAVETAPEQRQAKMASLLQRSDARRAHPSFEHLLPIYVGAGAAGADVGKQLWTLCEGPFSWAQFRFGEVSA